mgnify:CR=1 FL=1
MGVTQALNRFVDGFLRGGMWGAMAALGFIALKIAPIVLF